MIRLRKKILIFSALSFVCFASALFPLVEWMIRQSIPSPTDEFGRQRLTIGWFLLTGSLLALYAATTWMIVYRLTRPVQRIIDAILAYKKGSQLPETITPRDEIEEMANIFSSLNAKVGKQFERFCEQKRWAEGILDSLGEGVIALNTEAKITFINAPMLQRLKMTRQQLLGTLLAASETRWMQRGHELVMQVLQTFEPSSETGSDAGVHFNLMAIPLPHQKGAVLVFQDKTADFRMLEVGKDFIANASHELKTPITILRGFAEALKEISQLSPEMKESIAEKIIKTTERLDVLIKSLLVLNEVENLSEKNLRVFDLIAVIENAKHMILAAHRKCEIRIHSPCDQVFAWGDPDLIDLALFNLLENAVKYSKGAVEIDLSVSEKGPFVEIRISDRGIGIPEKDLPRIFDRFFTVDKAHSRKKGGAGLGLSIVKTIIEKHKGKIAVASTLGQGSEFTLQLLKTSSR